MEILILQKKVSLPSCYLNQDYKQSLYNKLNMLLKNKCTKEHGYVVNINPDLKILDNSINSNCMTLFTIEFSLETLKPYKNQILEGHVCMIFDQGIFVEIQGKMKVLIPASKYVGKYKYVIEDNVFSHNDMVIKEGDIISVKIELINYDKKGFNCIGYLSI
jgi:DNA-directed RNA polymerase subunit E'/Rpb7